MAQQQNRPDHPLFGDLTPLAPGSLNGLGNPTISKSSSAYDVLNALTSSGELNLSQGNFNNSNGDMQSQNQNISFIGQAQFNTNGIFPNQNLQSQGPSGAATPNANMFQQSNSGSATPVVTFSNNMVSANAIPMNYDQSRSGSNSEAFFSSPSSPITSTLPTPRVSVGSRNVQNNVIQQGVQQTGGVIQTSVGPLTLPPPIQQFPHSSSGENFQSPNFQNQLSNNLQNVQNQNNANNFNQNNNMSSGTSTPQPRVPQKQQVNFNEVKTILNQQNNMNKGQQSPNKTQEQPKSEDQNPNLQFELMNSQEAREFLLKKIRDLQQVPESKDLNQLPLLAESYLKHLKCECDPCYYFRWRPAESSPNRGKGANNNKKNQNKVTIDASIDAIDNHECVVINDHNVTNQESNGMASPMTVSSTNTSAFGTPNASVPASRAVSAYATPNASTPHSRVPSQYGEDAVEEPVMLYGKSWTNTQVKAVKSWEPATKPAQQQQPAAVPKKTSNRPICGSSQSLLCSTHHCHFCSLERCKSYDKNKRLSTSKNPEKREKAKFKQVHLDDDQRAYKSIEHEICSRIFGSNPSPEEMKKLNLSFAQVMSALNEGTA